VVCGGMGYSVAELTTLAICSVPFGELSSLGVGAGESVIVAPASGVLWGCGGDGGYEYGMQSCRCWEEYCEAGGVIRYL
jgi:hypothetical protein